MKQFIILISLCLIPTVGFGASQTVGSDSTVATPQANWTFDGLENKVANYAVVDEGFSMLDENTTCSFASMFPVKGSVSLKKGRMFLNRNLYFSGNGLFTNAGYVYGNQHNILFSEETDDLDSTDATTYYFDNTNIHLESNLIIKRPIVFSGTCCINGGNKKITIESPGQIDITSGSELKIINTKIKGLKDTNLKCLANDAFITIRNSKLYLNHNFEFATGSILFKMDVTISGTNQFLYSSIMTTSIDSDSTLIIKPGITFKYAPQSSNRNLLYMTDQTSNLFLNGCTLHSTKTGLQLTNGTLTIDNKVTFSGEGIYQSEAICFGNNNAQNNLNIELYADAEINIYGRLEYENTN